jgi:RNA polymerase sigma-70 factor (ECF subfamily)
MSSSDSDFARVYDDHLRHVYGFLAYRVRDGDLAEDLTQSTFERALRAWPRFDPSRASERTWLLVIARNLLIDHHRRDHRELQGEIDERDLPAVSGPEEKVLRSARLQELLAALNGREREIIALRFGADLTGPEIAELMELSLANVQQILSRSLRRLRLLLEGRDESDA